MASRMTDSLMVKTLCENVLLCQWKHLRRPSEYFRSNIYVDPMGERLDQSHQINQLKPWSPEPGTPSEVVQVRRFAPTDGVEAMATRNDPSR